jgi:chromosome segregation protein
VHLRAITLAGFKTFARVTEIHFEDGVTAIVGPNGSGKTNIVDAFKWVLGEANARDLRGRRMEEVVYAGGERRPRAAFAEVTLLLDNTDGSLPVDYSEVAIRRRVDRGGQSDYFLNGTRVRRRDLLEILASTGLTVDSYAIVNQSDIESIVTCTPQERRQLLEEAARVRGVKAKRTEAADRLQELNRNLVRLEDVRGEIGPRLELVKAQADAAREAEAAQRRLGMLRGSLAWEEWREARAAHKRADSQAQSLARRLAEARAQSELAETDYKRWRLEVQAAQDRRLRRQEALSGLKLELATARHQLELAGERRRGHQEQAARAAGEADELGSRHEVAIALLTQLEQELATAEAGLAAVPEDPGPPPAGAADDHREATRAAETARRRAAEAAAALNTLRARRGFLEEGRDRLQAQVGDAESKLPAAEKATQESMQAAAAAAAAESELMRKRAELEGLEALRPPAQGLPRLADVITAERGYEAALAAVLGLLLDAEVAPDRGRALAAAPDSAPQRTVLYPPERPAPESHEGSLFEHVRCQSGYEGLAIRLLRQVVIGGATGPRVTLSGEYSEAGLVRRGVDARAELAARRRDLAERIGELEPQANRAPDARARSEKAAAALAELRRMIAQRVTLEDDNRQLEAVLNQEAERAAELPALEAAAAETETRAGELQRQVVERQQVLAEHRAEVARQEVERQRWRDRTGDRRRQLEAVSADIDGLAVAREERTRRSQAAAAEAAALESRQSELEAQVFEIGARLQAAEADSPEGDAELAEAARRLLAVEEARVDCRLRVSTLEGNLNLIRRDAELAEARIEDIRARLPEGLAPEEVPGGKAREREIRALERRLEEIGPTNPLAIAECEELEERHRTLAAQLEDIAAARRDLDQVIERLRAEEESRYEAVFGAVAANFQELFERLSPGGRATLRHVPGEDGPWSGVDILVQPPRKRLQRATLLSSGERSLAALALVLALEAVNPSPFVILDEADAALDDANVGRFGEVVSELGRSRQFLVITHNHVTMAGASSLYGIHLDESGSSHVVSVRLEDVRRSERRPAATA